MQNLSYRHGFALDADVFVIVAEYDDASAAGEEHCEIFQFVKGKWFHYLLDFAGAGVAVVADDGVNHVVTVGVDGDFHEAARTGDLRGILDGTREGPENRGHLRCVRRIGDEVFAAGMGRQVYRRTGPGQWQRSDQGALLPLGTEAIKGFHAIDGRSADDLVAVGIDGEIFWFDGSTWTQAPSVTSAGLHCVKAISGGPHYLVGGSAGTLLRGHRDDWTVVVHGLDLSTLRSIEVFGDAIFLATHDGLYRLGDTLEPIQLGEGPKTFGVLHAAHGVLWSLGQRDLFVFDGIEWQERVYAG